jgi:hypothetical protein
MFIIVFSSLNVECEHPEIRYLLDEVRPDYLLFLTWNMKGEIVVQASTAALVVASW